MSLWKCSTIMGSKVYVKYKVYVFKQWGTRQHALMGYNV